MILYADRMTDSIRTAVNETKRRREIQTAFNKEHGITPKSIVKDVSDLLPPELAQAFSDEPAESSGATVNDKGRASVKMTLSELERAMWESVERLDFEMAAAIRDTIAEIKAKKGDM